MNQQSTLSKVADPSTEPISDLISPTLRETLAQEMLPSQINELKGHDIRGLLNVVDGYAQRQSDQGDHGSARQILIQSLAIKQNNPQLFPHAETFSTMYRLAEEYSFLNDLSATEATWREMLNHPEEKKDLPNLAVMYNLAVALNQQKKFVEAEKILRDLLPQLKLQTDEGRQQREATLRELEFATSGQKEVV